ncbi:hypothetical protein Mapa_002319 [Marchantia paleacea]|nr:hypothetical protein Mapa_002319 [Marchantia paleacea]
MLCYWTIRKYLSPVWIQLPCAFVLFKPVSTGECGCEGGFFIPDVSMSDPVRSFQAHIGLY